MTQKNSNRTPAGQGSGGADSSDPEFGAYEPEVKCQEYERACAHADWLLAFFGDFPVAAAEMMRDRSLPCLDPKEEPDGILGLVNAHLGWGRYRVSLCLEEGEAPDGFPTHVAVSEWSDDGERVAMFRWVEVIPAPDESGN